MTEKKSYEFFLKLKDLISQETNLNEIEKKYFLKLVLYDVDFITDGSLKDYILQNR